MFPYYLLYGMTANEFWDAPPFYATAYRQKYKLYLEQKNQELWMQGLYIYNAFGTSIANAFGKKGKQAKYMDKPIDILPKTKRQRQNEIENDIQKTINSLNTLKERFDSRHHKKGGEKNNDC